MKKKTRKTLFERIIGGKHAFDKLEEKHNAVEDNLAVMKENHKSLKKMLVENRTTLAFADGRISPVALEIASKVLDKAEICLIELDEEIQAFVEMKSKLQDALLRIKKSRVLEDKTLEIEAFMKNNQHGSRGSVKKVLGENFEFSLIKESKQLAHAADALLDLKAGSSHE